MTPPRIRSGRLPASAALLVFLAALGFAACGGDSAFPTLSGGGAPGTGGAQDRIAPTVEIQAPGEGFSVAVGDSVLVQVRVRDNQAVTSLALSGFALRGVAALGTEQQIPRFATKSVEFGTLAAVRDTVITRFLLATADTTRENAVFLVAVATDAGGNTAADTVRISIGGPRVQIVSPVTGQDVRAGTQLEVTVSARDRVDQIRAVRLQLTGAVEATLAQDFPAPQDSVSVTFTYVIPPTAVGEIRLVASAESRANIQAFSAPVVIRTVAPTADNTPPTVRFSIVAQPRMEVRDTIEVSVSATDDTRVDSVGVFLRTFRMQGVALTPLTPILRSVPGSTNRFRVAIRDILNTADTATVALEITAFAVDSARNCAFAIIPDRESSTRCRTDAAGSRVFTDPGARVDIFIARGRTVGLPTAGSRIADLASDGRRVFLSNLAGNAVEVLGVGDSVFSPAISVGSEPWGLAIGYGGNDLYVANSGGTNISVVPLNGGGTLRETRRIRTSDIRLYDVTYDVPTDTTATVVMIDYSDRPQFIAQTNAGQLLYSTKPTPTRADGTVRIVDPSRDTTFAFNRGSEIFIGYAGLRQGKATVVNALDAGKAAGGILVVCPRRLLPTQNDPSCVSGFVTQVATALFSLRQAGLTDTRLDINRDAATIGLSDTTFVAVSGDHSTVAFGEGVVQFGRIMLFGVRNGNLLGSSTHTQDLVGNVAERVIGLALNADGSLGVARGAQVYFFSNNTTSPNLDPSLRLQGIVQSGAPTGGVAVHPENRGYPNPTTGSRLGFASGMDERGVPYVDVLDAYSFRTVRRFFIRDPVVGALIAVPVAANDPLASSVALRLFAVTSGGVLQIDLAPTDLVNPNL
ncbi:hypothetical protein BH23GEM4_BH23GEM4_19640 [soil metagenome]